MKGLGAKTGQIFPVQYNMIDDHLASRKLDAFGFTTYPHLEFDNPSELPNDYYDELTNRVGGRVIIYSEIGWFEIMPSWNTDQENPDTLVYSVSR